MPKQFIKIVFFTFALLYCMVCDTLYKLTPAQRLQLKYDEISLKQYFNSQDIAYFKKNLPKIKTRKNELIRYALTARKLESGLVSLDLLHGIVSIHKTSINGVPIKGAPVLRVTLMLLKS
jgi:hypothetical protein